MITGTGARARRRRAASLTSALAMCWAMGTALTLSTAPPAAAHAALVSSTPEAGARLDAAPSTVTLSFSEPMQDPAYVVITAPDGTRSDAEASLDTTTVTQQMPANMEGTYAVAFRVVSEDGHPVSDEWFFDVGEPSDVAPSSTGSSTEGQPEAAELATSSEPGAASPGRPEPGLLDRLAAWQFGVALALFAAAFALGAVARRARP
ncbi:copper resistance CopC family protein [Nocardioides sp. R-C-SC26]|uniref:copper resistance CopC family protein n=1 Tax=Nocardioides sp. R-C-SC26 TaxID=2870414 RepID=UPI001E2C25C2|nr:copper resistance CopC family protein [Nocardioides sp. R-C-SC26]